MRGAGSFAGEAQPRLSRSPVLLPKALEERLTGEKPAISQSTNLVV
jgi:hypothetical protein